MRTVMRCACCSCGSPFRNRSILHGAFRIRQATRRTLVLWASYGFFRSLRRVLSLRSGCLGGLRLAGCSGMPARAPTMSRRDLLRRGMFATAGLALAATVGELATGVLSTAPAKQPGPPGVPRFRTRGDLRIPALSVIRSQEGVSEDPIFIAPYNAPNGQAGAVIAENSGEPLWENPLPGRVTTNFGVQSYRGSPVLVWWEGEIELGHGVGEYVIADSAYRTVRRVQAAHGLRGDLHEFVITPRDTALLTSYVIRKADLRAVGGPRDGTIQDAIFQEVDLATGRLL